MHFKILIHWNFVCSTVWWVGFAHMFICREAAIMYKYNQGQTNLNRSVMICVQHRSAFFGPTKAQVGSFNTEYH